MVEQTTYPTFRDLNNLMRLFEIEHLGPQPLAGFAEPRRAWRVVRDSGVMSRFEALRGEALTPFVGREEEIELLLRRWQRVITGEGQVVLLSGDAGIGKSRLVARCTTGWRAIRIRADCNIPSTARRWPTSMSVFACGPRKAACLALGQTEPPDERPVFWPRRRRADRRTPLGQFPVPPRMAA
jgi:hypothetical protein